MKEEYQNLARVTIALLEARKEKRTPQRTQKIAELEAELRDLCATALNDEYWDSCEKMDRDADLRRSLRPNYLP